MQTNNNIRGAFISLEGGDGSGKSTQLKLLTDYLTERGVDYIQGYYFSKPVNEDKFLEVISA